MPATRKPSAKYVTEAGQTITATRLNPEHTVVYGRRYDVQVDGVSVATLVQVGRDFWSWDGGNPPSHPYIGSLKDHRMIVSVAGPHLKASA